MSRPFRIAIPCSPKFPFLKGLGMGLGVIQATNPLPVGRVPEVVATETGCRKGAPSVANLIFHLGITLVGYRILETNAHTPHTIRGCFPEALPLEADSRLDRGCLQRL